MRKSAKESAEFERLDGGRSRIVGPLDFSTVTRLLPRGAAAIAEGHTAVIDLAGVTHSDSSALALLIEWLSLAREAQHPLRYENMPAQLHQLAHLSEVDDLLTAL